MKDMPEFITEFDERLWAGLVDSITVHSKDRIVFRNGEKTEAYPLAFDDWMSAEGAASSVRAAKTGDGLILHVCHILTPFETVLRLSFTEHGTEIRGKRNVGFGGGEYRIVGIRV